VTQFQFVSPHPFVLAVVFRHGVAEQWRFDMDNRSEKRFERPSDGFSYAIVDRLPRLRLEPAR
jgi:hypothetical protein